jgi:hypothetical protein
MGAANRGANGKKAEVTEFRRPEDIPYTPRKGLTLKTKDFDQESMARAYAENFTGSAMAALRVILAADKSAGYEAQLDYPGLLDLLREQGTAVNAGSLELAEAMLMNQATALQSVATRLLERGMGHTEIAPFEANMRMGLRAQSQCRATLETLAAIKNPAPVAFVKQANFAHGPQQVNNGVSPPSRAGESEIEQNKLLEVANGERLDTGTASASGRANQKLETVGAVNRSAKSGRKGKD